MIFKQGNQHKSADLLLVDRLTGLAAHCLYKMLINMRWVVVVPEKKTRAYILLMQSCMNGCFYYHTIY